MKTKIKVLQVGMSRNIGGIETYLMEQYRHIDKDKIQYDFVNITGEYEMAFSEEICLLGGGLFSIVSRKKNPLKHYISWFLLLYHHRKKYDVLIMNVTSWYYAAPLFFARLMGIKKRIFHMQNAESEEREVGWRRALSFFNKLLVAWSCTSFFACSLKAGEKMLGNRKFIVMPTCIDVDKFQYDAQIQREIKKKYKLENSFVVGHVGRFSPLKNHDFLLDVFAEVLKKRPQSVLLLIGNTHENMQVFKKIEQKIKEIKIDKNVLMLGVRSDVNELMQAFDVFVLPSKSEGFGIVGLEAQTMGLPCFVSDSVPQEMKVTDLVEYISLEETPAYWADKILCRNNVRRSYVEEIRNAGYDINQEIKKHERFLLSDT